MYVVLEKEKPVIGIIRGLNLAAVRFTTVLKYTNIGLAIYTRTIYDDFYDKQFGAYCL
jgi:hypothetical protein